MSIEKDLSRIADALENIASSLSKTTDLPAAPAVSQVTEQPKQEQQSEAPEVPKPPATPVASPTTTGEEPAAPASSAPLAAPTAEPTATTMSMEELNNSLVAEVGRLGGREKIDEVLRSDDFAVTSLTDLPESKYQALLDEVKTLAP